jgi:predicted AlkP superfamily phosphohydrolase/phosphomutase
LKRWLPLLLACAAAAPAFPWGFDAHRLVNRQAIATLPPPLRAFFEKNADYITEHAIDPDLWRGAGRDGEDPNHFLDMDAFGDPSAIPRDETELRRRHGADAASKGRVPFRIAEVHAELVQAFKDRDGARILDRAATLGHYVADAHVPLHAVLNYDGQLTGQKGLHARWESDLFARFQRQLAPQVKPAPARAREDAVKVAFEALGESLQDAAPVLDSDRAEAGPQDFADTQENDRYSDAYFSGLFVREEPRVVRRLTSGAERLGALWLGAWQAAGRPELPDFHFPYVRRGARLLIASIDGAAAPVVTDAVKRGVMPNLARLRERGASAQGSLTSLPAKTPAGHATVFTGAWPDRNGIAGIEVPIPGANVLTARSGYTSEMLRAEPIWVTAARQGLDVALMSATQSFPFAPFLEEKRFGGNFGWRLTLVDSYQNRVTPQAAISEREVRVGPAAGWRGVLPAHAGSPRDFDFVVGGERLEGLLYDDPADPVAGFDTLYLATDKRAGSGIVLKAEPSIGSTDAFRSLTLHTANGDIGLHFRLFALAPDASKFLLYLAEGGFIRSNRPLLESAALRATGGFVGNGGDELYKEGVFGPPLWKNGDGTAEARYLETALLVERQFERLADFGIDRTRWDVLFAYLPFPDEQLHLWYGYMDPALRGHDPALAARLRPFVDQGLAIADRFVGHLADKVGEETIVAVVSDHGMMAANRNVLFNVALQKAGLLTLTADGDVDLFRTQAVYFPGNSGYFLVNRVDRREGVVTPEEEPAVLARLKAALLAMRDPETQQPIVTAVLDPRDGPHEPGIGGPIGGDLYVQVAPGYYASAALRGDVVQSRRPGGEHLFDPERPELHASFALAGPGVAQGVDLGLVRQIDIAPTLSALLGIDPPAQAQGVVLQQALERKAPSVAGR